jgi:hypothetical protein
VRQHDYHKRRYVRAYLQVVHNQTVGRSPSERFLFGRLEGLTQVVLARATAVGS